MTSDRQTPSDICVTENSLLFYPEIDLYILSRSTLLLVSLLKRSLKLRFFRDHDDGNNNDDNKRTCQCVLRLKVMLIVLKR
jgi:hypothetical protein